MNYLNKIQNNYSLNVRSLRIFGLIFSIGTLSCVFDTSKIPFSGKIDRIEKINTSEDSIKYKITYQVSNYADTCNVKISMLLCLNNNVCLLPIEPVQNWSIRKSYTPGNYFDTGVVSERKLKGYNIEFRMFLYNKDYYYSPKNIKYGKVNEN